MESIINSAGQFIKEPGSRNTNMPQNTVTARSLAEVGDGVFHPEDSQQEVSDSVQSLTINDNSFGQYEGFIICHDKNRNEAEKIKAEIEKIPYEGENGQIFKPNICTMKNFPQINDELEKLEHAFESSTLYFILVTPEFIKKKSKSTHNIQKREAIYKTINDTTRQWSVVPLCTTDMKLKLPIGIRGLVPTFIANRPSNIDISQHIYLDDEAVGKIKDLFKYHHCKLLKRQEQAKARELNPVSEESDESDEDATEVTMPVTVTSKKPGRNEVHYHYHYAPENVIYTNQVITTDESSVDITDDRIVVSKNQSQVTSPAPQGDERPVHSAESASTCDKVVVPANSTAKESDVDNSNQQGFKQIRPTGPAPNAFSGQGRQLLEKEDAQETLESTPSQTPTKFPGRGFRLTDDSPDERPSDVLVPETTSPQLVTQYSVTSSQD